MTKISELTEATSLTGNDYILVSDAGTDKKMKISALDASIIDTGAWSRPTDWPALPADAAQTIVMSVGVWSTQTAKSACALSVTLSAGTYSVDWGDGTVDSGIASGATASHIYDYADGDLGSATSEGIKVALLKITTSGGNITAYDLGKKHGSYAIGDRLNTWLDMRINTPSATAITVRSTIDSIYVRAIDFTGLGNVTSLVSAFQSCYALQSVSFPSGSLASVTSLASAFLNCSALQSVSFPSGSLASVTSLVSAFWNCYALQSVSFPSGSLASVTSLASAFNNCYALQSVSFPAGSLASVTTLANAFQSCNALQSVSFPDEALTLGATLTLASAFQNCPLLRSITFPVDVGGAPLPLSTVNVTTNAFTSCPALETINNCAIPVSFSVASCNLGAAALDAIYTALPSVSATITVTGNPGTASDTPTIATGKGWTVTGS